MLTVQRGVSLRPYTTFGIEAQANYFADIATETDLDTFFELTEFDNLPKLILGRWPSNLLPDPRIFRVWPFALRSAAST